MGSDVRWMDGVGDEVAVGKVGVSKREESLFHYGASQITCMLNWMSHECGRGRAQLLPDRNTISFDSYKVTLKFYSLCIVCTGSCLLMVENK